MKKAKKNSIAKDIISRLVILYRVSYIFKFILLSLPVVIFVFGFIWHPSSSIGGDWDYFLQLYEAFRRTVLQYGQFPWWNPWVAGSVPLYANPQFGLISIQTPLVLLFGSLYGLKIAVVVYYLIGFWGMYLLVKQISKDELKAVVLAYIFCFGGFAVWHVAGGHLTFATYYLFPLILFLFTRRYKTKWGWLWLGLSLVLFINSAPHYIVIQACTILAAIYVFDYVRRYKLRLNIGFVKDMGTLVIALGFSIHKLLFSYQYLKDFPRILEPQKVVDAIVLLKALFWPYYFGHPNAKLLGLQYGWGEYTAYIGFLVFFLVIGVLIYQLVKKQSRNIYSLVCFAVAFVCGVIAAGPFSKFAPYRTLLRLPVFNAMGVPSRWLGWTTFFIILGLAFFPKKSKVIYIVLACVAIELFVLHSQAFYRSYQHLEKPQYEADFEQFTNYMADDANRFYKATLANRGETRGYEPILGYDYNSRPTQRAGINFGGLLVSENAKVIYWSPNKITLERLADGPIELNVNPGDYWRVNGKQIFRNYKVTEPNAKFIIDDPAKTIVCKIKPSYSLLIPGER